MMRTTVVIADGAAISSPAELGPGWQLLGLEFPASFTGATCTFQGSIDGTNYFPVMIIDGASAYTVTAADSSYVPIDPRVFAGLQRVKVVSVGNETGDKTIGLAVGKVLENHD